MFSVSAMSACQPAKTVAERCYLVSLQQEKGRDLIPFFDEFARKNGLDSDKSSPFAFHYSFMSGESESVLISLSFGIGEFGTQLALFRFDESHNVELVEKFDAFVTGDLAERYEVKKCTDVPDYGLPQIWQTIELAR